MVCYRCSVLFVTKIPRARSCPMLSAFPASPWPARLPVRVVRIVAEAATRNTLGSISGFTLGLLEPLRQRIALGLPHLQADAFRLATTSASVPTLMPGTAVRPFCARMPCGPPP